MRSQKQLKRNARHINPHSRREGFADQETPGARLPRARSEGMGQELVRGVNLTAEIVRHHDAGENQTGQNIPQHHLDKGKIAPVGQRRNSDDRERARLRRQDRKTNRPPGHILAPEEIIARVPLVFAEPGTQGNNPPQIAHDDKPVRRVEVNHAFRTAARAGRSGREIHLAC